MTTGEVRPYRSELRQRQAAETRQRVVAAAGELFGRRGYRATTLAQLARTAGVSVETVRKHGPKSALLQAAIELASFGVAGETDFLETELGRAWLQVPDPDELAEFAGATMLAINERAAGLWTAMISAAEEDPEVSAFRDRLLAAIRAKVDRTVRVLADRGWLRRDVAVEDLIEAFCVITSIETYLRFVRIDGRPAASYSAFVARTVRETILARDESPDRNVRR